MGVWIETTYTRQLSQASYVTPYVGVWIETIIRFSRTVRPAVTPYVGVWIETGQRGVKPTPHVVTPYVGVWIETYCSLSIGSDRGKSLLMWECGLKPRCLRGT